MYFIYAIYNSNHNKIYIGQTKDLAERLKMHNNHVLKGYTSRFDGNWKLIYCEELRIRSEVIAREKQLKSYRGRQFIKNFIKK
jgi:putative endonuclease